MKNFDIALYGHLSFDNIYDGFNNTTSVGCIGNVWAQLKLINPDLKVAIEPSDLGESLIMTDRKQCKRTSISRLSLRSRKPLIHDAKISHVMYINELSNTSWVKDLKGFVTADICNGKPLNHTLEALEHVDMLFVSDEDFINLKLHLVDLQRKINNILIHSPDGSMLLSGNKMNVQTAESVDNINVLGAGDKFAAYVLAGLLEDNTNKHKVIQRAHDKLTQYYKNEKV